MRYEYLYLNAVTFRKLLIYVNFFIKLTANDSRIFINVIYKCFLAFKRFFLKK